MSHFTVFKTTRVLGIGSRMVVLLDAKTRQPIKQEQTNTLSQWRIGSGVSKHGVFLEFVNGQKWDIAGGCQISYTYRIAIVSYRIVASQPNRCFRAKHILRVRLTHFSSVESPFSRKALRRRLELIAAKRRLPRSKKHQPKLTTHFSTSV